MKPENELPSTSEIAELVEQAVSTLDGLEAHPTAAYQSAPDDQAWTGWVSMGGGFEGAVTLQCPRRLVQRLASAMLAAPPDEISEESARDAFGELTHIVAGNIKSLIAVPAGGPACALVERKVVSGAFDVPGATARREAHFTCSDDAFSVRVWESRETR
jgi:chemotaxis phosphatase CheX-like protein